MILGHPVSQESEVKIALNLTLSVNLSRDMLDIGGMLISFIQRDVQGSSMLFDMAFSPCFYYAFFVTSVSIYMAHVTIVSEYLMIFNVFILTTPL